MNHEALLALLNRYHLRPDKKLGQHYLLDETVIDKTITAGQINDGELVLEIGAGPGVLTKALAQAGADVLAVEFDRDFCRLLQEEYHNWRNVHILCDDALRLDFKTLARDGKAYKKIVANIPYQITNPLVRKILEPGSQIERAVLLIQKEVADRLAAPVGSSERGILTLMIEYYGLIEKVVDVPAGSFWPAPKVESAVVVITRYPQPAHSVSNEAGFFWFIKQGFSGKRKTIVNSLAGGLHLEKTAVNDLLNKAEIDPQLRAEDLSLMAWRQLFENYAQQYVDAFPTKLNE